MTSPSNNLVLDVASGSLDIRQFTVQERISGLFQIDIVAVSADSNIDFDAVVGGPARFLIQSDVDKGVAERFWTGICKHIEQVAVDEGNLSTYHLTIVPILWLTTQRRDYRMFQQITELDIVLKLLKEWEIEPELKITGTYKKRKYRVQYAESDFAFMSRMLEDAGISFYFDQGDGESKLVLSDGPQANPPRAKKIAFRDNPMKTDQEHVTRVRVGQQVRPGRYTMRDHDYRRPPSYNLVASADASNTPIEGDLERYHYTPGAFLFGADKGEDTPVADDKGKARTDEKEAEVLARKRLDAKRSNAKVCTFETNVLDLAPGVVMSMLDHPRADLGEDKKLLIVESRRTGIVHGDYTHRCEARSADLAYRPPLITPKPKISGVESATVVGSAGEEIHTDEFGRVRVHFHWDRDSKMDDNSSCWIHVSQPWGGGGYGGVNLPRVGQEVLVDFLGGDPDRPIITGRVYTNLQKTPYKLPVNKTQSGWKSESSPGGGGFNEIRFEDAKGKEQVYMQAEKDLKRLVKHNEDVNVVNDRSVSIGHNDSLMVGNDRSRLVGNNETVTIGANQTITVGANQTITLPSGNQTESITGNRSFTLVGDLTENITGNATLTQTGNQTETLTGNRTLTQTGDRTLTQTGNLTETITGNATLTQTGSQTETLAGDRTLTQTGNQSETLSGDRSLVQLGNQSAVVAGNSSLLQMGNQMEGQLGNKTHIQLGSQTEIQIGGKTRLQVGTQTETIVGSETLTATAALTINGATITVQASGETVVKGSIIKLN